MQCCDITYDVTAPFNDITSANKMTCFRHATSSTPTQNCLKAAVEQEQHGHSTPRVPGVPRNATYIPLSDDKHQFVQKVHLTHANGHWEHGHNSNPVATLPHTAVVLYATI